MELQLVHMSISLILSFFDTIQVSMIRISHFVYTSMGILMVIGFGYHTGLFPMQEPSYLCKITLSMNMV